VVRIVGKGNQPALIPLAPRTSRAIDAAVGERTDGPLLARADGSRLDRHAAGRIVRRLARRAGIDKPMSPHSLRHAAITAALDAGCSLRDVQDFARRPAPDPPLRPRPRRTRPQPHLHRRHLPRRRNRRPVTLGISSRPPREALGSRDDARRSAAATAHTTEIPHLLRHG